MTCKGGRVSDIQSIIDCETDISHPADENNVPLTDCFAGKRGRLNCEVNGQTRWQIDGIPCLELYDAGGAAYGEPSDVMLQVVPM